MSKSNLTVLTKDMVKSTKWILFVCAALSIVLEGIVLFSLYQGGFDFIYYAVPLALFVIDVLLIVVAAVSNFRFGYTVAYPICYAVLTLAGCVLIFLSNGIISTHILHASYALYAWIIVHALSFLSVIFASLHAAKKGKGASVLSVITMILLFVATVGYTGIVVFEGWFGQGGTFEEDAPRTLSYDWNEETQTYEVTGVLNGKGNTVVVPLTFNDKEVSVIDCSAIAASGVSVVRIDSEKDKARDIELRSAAILTTTDVKLYTGEATLNKLRRAFFEEALKSKEERFIVVADKLIPQEEGKKFVTFTYDYDDLKAVGGNVLNCWSGDADDVFDLQAHAEAMDVEYVSKSNLDVQENLYWSYDSLDKRIFKGAFYNDKAFDTSLINEEESGVYNLKMEFERLYTVNVEEDNDQRYEVDNSFKYGQYGGETRARIVTKDTADAYLASYQTREGFDLQWSCRRSIDYKDFNSLSEVVSDGIYIKPIWTMQAPIISEIATSATDNTATYGDSVELKSTTQAASAALDLRYSWTKVLTDGTEAIANTEDYTLSNIYPSQAGRYRLSVTSYSDSLTSLTSNAYAEVDLAVNKKALNVEWILPLDTVYSASDKAIDCQYQTADVINSDTIELSLSQTSVRNAAVYVLSVALTGSCADLYYIPAAQTRENIEITPAPLHVTWTETSWIYQGTERAPIASAIGLGEDGDIQTLVSGGKTDAGNYIATVEIFDTNYEVENAECSFQIEQKEISVVWSAETQFVYDGQPHRAAVESIDGEIDGEEDSVILQDGYLIYSDGERDVFANYETSVALPTYSNYKLVGTTTCSYEITHRPITLVWQDTRSFVYNGEVQGISVVAVENEVDGEQDQLLLDLIMSSNSDVEKTNAGTWTMSAALPTVTNYVLDSGEGSCDYEVTKREASLTWSIPSGDAMIYDTHTHTVSVTREGMGGLNNIAVLQEELESDFIYAENVQTNAGLYTAMVSVPSDSNFTIVSGASYKYQVKQREVRLTWTGNQFEYDGETHVVTVDLDKIEYVNAPADVETVQALDSLVRNALNYEHNSAKDAGSSYQASVSIADENFAIVNGETQSFHVDKRPISLTWETVDFTYDTTEKTIKVLSVSNAVENLEFSYENATNKNANTYTAKATVSNSNNYRINSGATQTYTIKPAPLAVSWANFSFEYNGATQQPTATAVGLGDDGNIALVVSGGNTNAGDYTATVSTTNTNYAIQNPTQAYKIEQRKLTLTWEEDVSLVYNGTMQTYPNPSISNAGGLETEIALNCTNLQKRNAGTYISKASVSNNFTIVSGDTFSYTIQPATVSVVWTNTELTYDNTALVPTATIAGLGNDGVIALSVAGEGGVNVGSYTATAALENDNYILQNTTQSFSIEAREVNLVWTNLTFEYDGKAKTPTASVQGQGSDGLLVATVVGEAGTDVGTYTATASLANANYVVKNPEQQYKIEQRKLTVVWEDVSFTYNGSEQTVPTPTLSNAGGLEAEINLTCENLTYKNAGSYTASASVSENFTIVSGATFAYEIKPATVMITWSNFTFEYDGIIHTASASAMGVGTDGALRLFVVDQDSKNVGTYTAVASIDDEEKKNNYVLANAEQQFSITAKELTLTWSTNTSINYTGAEQSFEATSISGKVSGETVEITYVYYDAQGSMISGLPKEAGTYTVKASVDGNYTIKATTAEKQFSIVAASGNA